MSYNCELHSFLIWKPAPGSGGESCTSAELPNIFSGFAIVQFTFKLMIHCMCNPPPPHTHKLWWSSYFKVIMYLLFKDE